MSTSILALVIVLLVAVIVGLSMALAQNFADNRRGGSATTATPRRVDSRPGMTTGPRTRNRA